MKFVVIYLKLEQFCGGFAALGDLPPTDPLTRTEDLGGARPLVVLIVH